jgi:hypothetical protein
MNADLDTSDWRLWVMCVIIVGCLALWLGAVFIAARSPAWRNPRTEIKGPVQGGRHMAAGGRSVAPDRDQLAMESGIPDGQDAPAQVPVPAQVGAAEPDWQAASVPRQALDRDMSVDMPAQRAGSPAGNVQHTDRS